jgi:hypothetical protein
MKQRVKVFFGKLVRLLLLVGLILLFLPHLTQGTISVVTGLLDNFSSEEIHDETQVIQAIASEVIPRSQIVCAAYTGVAIIREKLPVEFLGIEVYEVVLFKQLTGTVEVAVDMEYFELDNNLEYSEEDQSLSLVLPLPAISSCVLNTDGAFEVISNHLPFSSAMDIAMVEDAMMDNARCQLIRKALAANIIPEASDNLCSYVETLIREHIDPSIEVTVRTERRNERGDTDPVS